MKRKKRLTVSLVLFIGLFILMILIPISAYGKAETVNLSINGLIDANGRPMNNVKVTVYIVDNMEPVKRSTIFDQQDSKQVMKLTKELEDYISEYKPEPCLTKITDTGSLDIRNMYEGIYFLVYETDIKGVTIAPSLIGIPYSGNGFNKYIKIEPKIKYPKEDNPEKQKEKKPGKVKTNDLYKLGVYIGLMTASFGLILLVRNNEKEAAL